MSELGKKLNRFRKLRVLLQAVSDGVEYDTKLFTILNKVWTANRSILTEYRGFIRLQYGLDIRVGTNIYTDTFPNDKMIMIGLSDGYINRLSNGYNIGLSDGYKDRAISYK